MNASLDVYRLVAPPVGAQTVAVTHSKLGYDPVRVSVFTVRGANTTTPNGTVTEVNITPSTATATRTVSVLSSSDGLTISAVAASGMYVNGTGITSTAGFQTTRASGEDTDGIVGRPGQPAGRGQRGALVRPQGRRGGPLGIPDLLHGERRERSAATATSAATAAGYAGGERRIHDDSGLRHGPDSATFAG